MNRRIDNNGVFLVLLMVFFASQGFAQDPNFHIYLCFGQSNMAGAGTIENQDLTVDSRFQFMKPQDCPAQNQYAGNWYAAVPPLWGCSGGIGPSDYFGRTMVENMPENVNVGVVVVGVPGCKIELFGKTGYEGYDDYNQVPAKYNGSAYAWLLELAKKAQQDGVIKGFLLHQGESNTGDQQWPAKVKAVYDNLIADLELDASQTPLLSGELLYENQGGVCWGHNAIIAKLPSVLPNSYVISANGLSGQDIYHFNSEGNRTFGVRYAQQMLKLLPVGPSVSLTAPLDNASFAEGSSIVLEAEASDPEGEIEKIVFFQGEQQIGEDASAPYSFTWANVAEGVYKISALATSSTSKTAVSQEITLRVHPPQAPYAGKPHAIPGIVQFEEYDVGGNGFAYKDDSEGNEGGADFRLDEDVDLEDCSDTGGGFNLGWATAGEWLEYTVDVQKSGKYKLALRASCNGDGRTLSVSADGVLLAENMVVPNTEGWQEWTDVVIEDIQLDAGEQVFRLTIGDEDFVNLNYMRFDLMAVPHDPLVLKKGWNIIGYPFKESVPLETALQSIWQYVETVKDLDGFYETSIPHEFNSLGSLSWSKGYLIKVSEDCELLISN